MDYQHKLRIFISGVSEGIGQELAKELVRTGHAVWGVAQREDLLAELKKELQGGDFSYTVCHAEDEGEVEHTIRLMEERKFEPDIVILNAAGYVEDISSFYNHLLAKKNFEANLFGPLMWVSKFLPIFIRRKHGQFIAVSSISAFLPDRNSISYAGSKTALRMAFRSMRLVYNKDNVKFKMIHFGPVATSLTPYWVGPRGEKKYSFVLSANKAARFIIKSIPKSSLDYFFPFWLTLLIRPLSFSPDRIFGAVSRFLKRQKNH